MRVCILVFFCVWWSGNRWKQVYSYSVQNDCVFKHIGKNQGSSGKLHILIIKNYEFIFNCCLKCYFS